MQLGKDYRITICGVDYDLETLDYQGTVVGVVWDRDQERTSGLGDNWGSYVPAGCVSDHFPTSDVDRVYANGEIVAAGDEIVIGECLGDSKVPDMESVLASLMSLLGGLEEDCGECEACLANAADRAQEAN
jgi:hypothetical protein